MGVGLALAAQGSAQVGQTVIQPGVAGTAVAKPGMITTVVGPPRLAPVGAYPVPAVVTVPTMVRRSTVSGSSVMVPRSITQPLPIQTVRAADATIPPNAS